MRLTVTDDVGETDTVEHTVNVGTAAPIGFVDRATSNVNALSFSVQVPSTVQPGDALLLFASQSTATVLTGPGSDWTQEGRVVDAAHATTVWSRVAMAADAGRVIRLGSGSTYTKVALTLAAYRGTDQADPVDHAHGCGGARHDHRTHHSSRGEQHERRVAGLLLVGQEQCDDVVDGSGRRVEPGSHGGRRVGSRRLAAHRLERRRSPQDPPQRPVDWWALPTPLPAQPPPGPCCSGPRAEPCCYT